MHCRSRETGLWSRELATFGRQITYLRSCHLMTNSNSAEGHTLTNSNAAKLALGPSRWRRRPLPPQVPLQQVRLRGLEVHYKGRQFLNRVFQTLNPTLHGLHLRRKIWPQHYARASIIWHRGVVLVVGGNVVTLHLHRCTFTCAPRCASGRRNRWRWRRRRTTKARGRKHNCWIGHEDILLLRRPRLD